MILESALLDVRPGREDAFLADFATARELIAVQRGFRGLELRRCLDEGLGSRFLLQVEWETLADHTEGFRGSAEYQQWRTLLHPYYEPFPAVEHYGEPVLTAAPATAGPAGAQRG
ncbi:antibiotic biosynthesis monooxygenase family protein [Kitasatospora sp. NPDC059571]|uniref:antibiotic biosynthesis monooxygenase family protein n=1 Tax=Kitasatospora sp. NPDC059571 TaxID=3346871 RepID=UPI0036ABE232